MKTLTESINSRMNKVNESAHAEYSLGEVYPKGQEVAIGVIHDNGDQIGLIFGGTFKGGNQAQQKKAEAVLKKYNVNISSSYEDADEMDKDGDGPGYSGLDCCYFIPIEDFNNGGGAECYVFANGPMSAYTINN